MPNILLAFDLYGTLLSTESIAKQLSEHFGPEKAALVAATWRKYQLEYTWRYNSMKQFESFSVITKNTLLHTLAENGLQLDDNQVEKLMEAYDSLSTFPDVKPALKKLGSNTDIECVVFSNGTNSMVSNSVKKSEDLSPHSSLFTQIITVDDVKKFKPAPEVYEHLAKCVHKVGLEDEMWLISGNPFDVVGARAVGMQAAWVDRAGNGWQDKQGGQPTAIVQSLEELEEVVTARHQ